MYEGAKTTVRTKQGRTEVVPVDVGLHQGSALSPFLFLVVLDTLTSDLRNNEDLWELLFADNLVIISDTEEELQERFLTWKRSLERGGLKVNLGKTKTMLSCRGGYEEVNIQQEDGTKLKQNNEFKYLGSVIAEGGTEKAVRHRVKEAWRKCREVSGVVLDKRMPLKVKKKVYKSVVRPVLLYGAEI